MRLRKTSNYSNTDVIKLKPHDKKDLDLQYEDEVDIDKIKKVTTSYKPKESKNESK